MKKILITLIACAVLFYVTPTTADTLTEEMKTVSVAESLLQSTVVITVFGGGGSGFYIEKDKIITNHHVVKDAKSVLFTTPNGTMCLADVIFTQKDHDLALLKTDCEGKPLTIADNVKVGQSVLTMGNPLGQAFYLSKGVVGLMKDAEFLHDAVIDQGMSGGPVVNLNGQLIGVSQAYAKDAPKISIAINIKTLSYFLYQAKEE